MRRSLPFTDSPELARFIALTGNTERTGLMLAPGSLLLFPTETWYAMGCKLTDRDAIHNIILLKNRPQAKPLPLLAADLEQVSEFCDISAAPPSLLEAFWPGPLTIVLPAKRSLHPALMDFRKRVAIRVSSSSSACALARVCGSPLISTSANLAGGQPAARVEDLDPMLLERIGLGGYKVCILQGEAGSLSFSGRASTIVEAVKDFRGKWLLRILRPGVITESMLTERNFTIQKAG